MDEQKKEALYGKLEKEKKEGGYSGVIPDTVFEQFFYYLDRSLLANTGGKTIPAAGEAAEVLAKEVLVNKEELPAELMEQIGASLSQSAEEAVAGDILAGAAMELPEGAAAGIAETLAEFLSGILDNA